MNIAALHESAELADRVCAHLDVARLEIEQRDFEDGECKVRPMSSVRQEDVFVIQSLHGDTQNSPHDKLWRLILLCGALRDASAARLTVVIPYLCYARKDQQSQPRDPISTRYVAQAIESVGVDRVVTLDVHNLAAFQNAFRCRTDHLEAKMLFVSHFAGHINDAPVTVVSPDAGGVKRAERFRQSLESALNQSVTNAFMEKQRRGGVVSGEAFVGDADGRTAIILDDLISTGTTLTRTAKACRAHGATAVHAAATHGLFVGDANTILANEVLDSVVITNTVPPFRLTDSAARDKLTVLDVAPLLGEAIRRIQTGKSVVELLETPRAAETAPSTAAHGS